MMHFIILGAHRLVERCWNNTTWCSVEEPNHWYKRLLVIRTLLYVQAQFVCRCHPYMNSLLTLKQHWS